MFGASWRKQHPSERRLGANLSRPKGMHHRTHHRLCLAIIKCYDARDAALSGFMDRMNLQLHKLDERFKARR